MYKSASMFGGIVQNIAITPPAMKRVKQNSSKDVASANK